MKQISSYQARTGFRDVLDDVMRGEHVTISRWNRPAAVMVPPDWWQRARQALGENGDGDETP